MRLEVLKEDLAIKIAPYMKVLIAVAFLAPIIYIATVMFSMVYIGSRIPSTALVKSASFNDYVIAYDKFSESIHINTNFIKEIKDITSKDDIKVEVTLSNGEEFDATFRDIETKNEFIKQVEFNMEKRKWNLKQF